MAARLIRVAAPFGACTASTSSICMIERHTMMNGTALDTTLFKIWGHGMDGAVSDNVIEDRCVRGGGSSGPRW